MAKAGADLRGVVSFHGVLPTAPVNAGSIKAKILVCHGADDKFSGKHLQAFQQALIDAGADWQLIIYGGARYGFTNKQAAMSDHPMIQYNESADRRSWGAMLQFFDEIFSE